MNDSWATRLGSENKSRAIFPDRVITDVTQSVISPSFFQMLISVHIPKCGGTSFASLLREVYGCHLHLCYRDLGREYNLPLHRIPVGTKCIHGHFGATSFDEFVAPELVTWLRDPVERVVSNYYHFKRSPDPRNPLCARFVDADLSLTEFAAIPEMRNQMIHYFDRKSISDFAFIGILEQGARSLDLFKRRFAANVSPDLPRLNCNPQRIGTYKLSSRELFEIERLNAADRELYQEGFTRMLDESESIQTRPVFSFGRFAQAASRLVQSAAVTFL